MADFDIVVDTSPMARSIDGVSHNINATTTAVIAMQSAVVGAQQEASRTICTNVDRGFYTLMRSQLSQKIAECYSVMYSKKQLMENFSEQIEKIMVIMQDDYNRIKRRYTKQFNSLDKALETRIHELDKKSYELSRNQRNTKFKSDNEIIKTIVYGDETQKMNVQTISATVKNRSSKAIGCMSENILEDLNYTRTVKFILNGQSVHESMKEYVPVVVTEWDSMLATDSKLDNVYVPQDKFVQDHSELLDAVNSSYPDFNWSRVDQESYEKIKSSFMKMCGREKIDERVLKEMVRLFEQSKWNDAKSSDEKNQEGL